MGTTRVAVTIDAELLAEVDRLVAERVFPNRSRAIQEAVREKLARLRRSRLAEQCALLDTAVERRMAEEGLELTLSTERLSRRLGRIDRTGGTYARSRGTHGDRRRLILRRKPPPAAVPLLAR